MKDTRGTIEYKGREYGVVFNINVLEEIQDEDGTFEKWGELTDGVKSEVNAKALKFGIRAMLNEAIDIDNEENGTDVKPLTLKQVGRMITEIGFENAVTTLQETVVESTEGTEKNE